MSASLLPPNATQLEHSAVEAARIDDLDLKPVSNLWNPWECHISVLPYLAWALSVDVWDEDWADQVKRTVVAESIAMHRIKGTPGAVEQMCVALGYNVQVLEWHEYDGGHDRYKLRVKARMSDADYRNIIIGDRVAKRQSQERDAIQVYQQREGKIFMGGIVYRGRHGKIFPRLNLSGAQGDLHVSGVVYRGRRGRIYPHIELSGAQTDLHVGGVVQRGRISKLFPHLDLSGARAGFHFGSAVQRGRIGKIFPATGSPASPAKTTIYVGGVMHIARRRSIRSVYGH